MPLTLACGVGFGLFQVPNNRNMLLSAPRERSGAAGGMQGTARLAGQTAGAVVMTLLFTLTSADAAPRIGLLGIGASDAGLRGRPREHAQDRLREPVTAGIRQPPLFVTCRGAPKAPVLCGAAQ